jgi:predicted exporter
MNKTPGAIVLLAAWIIVLLTLGVLIERQLAVGADLRLFLPKPTTPQEKLLLNELGEGPASRILVVALSNAPTERLATASQALAAALTGNSEFQLVANGEASLDSIPDKLLPYRYLLSPTLDRQALNEVYLREQLRARARDLASPAGAFLEPILPRDPTLEILNLVQHWQPSQEPRREYDVWFDREGKLALLIVETVAPAFDPDRQERAIQTLQRAFEAVRLDPAMKIEITGAGAFSVLMKNRTQREIQWLGVADTTGMILLLLLAYRRFSAIVLSALPLVSAGAAGLFAVAWAFDAVHGITLAFGFTLIGVAQDYPLHLLSHRHAGCSARDTARELWPTLATGIASTCIAYLTFFFSGVNGLGQLAVFTMSGLGIAGLTTRFVMPHLLSRDSIDYGESKRLEKLQNKFAALPHFRRTLAVLLVVSIASLLFVRQPFWQNDLSTLTPVPRDLLLRDQSLRSELGTADVRYLFAVSAASDAAARMRLEALDAGLKALVVDGTIHGYDHIARYVPSQSRQLQRQQLLPEGEQLRMSLTKALNGLPFRDGVFEPFLEDVDRAKHLAPLTLADLHNTPLAARAEMFVVQSDTSVSALITLNGVDNPQALPKFAAAAGDDVLLLDLKAASEGLIAQQRVWILWSLSIASILLVGVIAFALRDLRRVIRVLAPMALTTVFILALLHGCGVSLSLFHLISLVLCAGLGLDYALFFEHTAHDPLEQRRTLHAVLVCSGSTLMVFALLIASSLPVLRAIGVTVTLGVVGNFFLALLITRDSPRRVHTSK